MVNRLLKLEKFYVIINLFGATKEVDGNISNGLKLTGSPYNLFAKYSVSVSIFQRMH